MMTTSKMLGLLAAAFVAGSFLASPELRAFAANTVGSTDIIDGQVMTVDVANNAITTAKIRDAEVKVADIGPDAVGGSELIGVTKLLFGQCVISDAVKTTPVSAGGFLQPINPDGSSIFKLKSTVIVKLQLTDYDGAFITDAVGKLSVAKITNQVTGDDSEAVSTGGVDSGNQFKYDSDRMTLVRKSSR